jgi:hypothetical protein
MSAGKGNKGYRDSFHRGLDMAAQHDDRLLDHRL